MVSAIRLGLATVALLASTAAAAVELEGVKLPERARIAAGGPELVLNGAGVRTRMIFKVYVAALYLPAKTDDGEVILRDDQPARLLLHMLRNLTASQLNSSINGALRDTLTPEQRAPLESRLKRFQQIFEEYEKLREGTQITIDYLPQRGTIILVDGEEKDRIPGADFNRALLRIWIGDRPRDPDLKKAILGKL